MIIRMSGLDPQSAAGRELLAMPFQWVAIHGYCTEVKTQDSLTVDLSCFTFCDGSGFTTTEDCTALADAIENHIEFTGTMGIVRRTAADEIECPDDEDMRKIHGAVVHNDGNLEPDGGTVFRATQEHVQELADFLDTCGGGFRTHIL